MPASLIKLYLGLTVNTDINSNNERWKSTFTNGTYNIDESRYEFVVGNFEDDQGNPPVAFPDITNGYYNLYINGALQQGDLSAILDVEGINTLVVNIAELAPEDEITPIVLEFVALGAMSIPVSDIVDAPKV